MNSRGEGMVAVGMGLLPGDGVLRVLELTLAKAKPGPDGIPQIRVVETVGANARISGRTQVRAASAGGCT